MIQVQECFTFTVKAFPNWTKRYPARVQITDATNDVMLRKYLCIKDLHLCFRDVHKKSFQAGKCLNKCQLNRAKPRQVKGNSYKLSQNQP